MKSRQKAVGSGEVGNSFPLLNSMAVSRIIEQSRVSPPPGSVAEASLPLIFFDLIWLNADPVERILLYPFPHRTDHFLHAILPALKSSLSLALRRFFPLVGRLRRSPADRDRFEIHYVDGDSVAFTLSELVDGEFADLCGSHEREIAKLLPLIPRLDTSGHEDRPLFAVHLTLFPGHGLSVGVAIHHVVCDGTATIHFMKTWAAICRSCLSSSAEEALPPPTPSFDRTVVADPRGLYPVFLKSFSGTDDRQLDLDDDEISTADLVCSTFTLRRDDIKLLKELSMGKATGGKKSPLLHCSTIVAVYAYAWVCFVRAGRHSGNRVTHMVFAADCRERLSPPVPAGSFGNFLRPCVPEIEVETLKSEDGFVAAAAAISEAIEEFKSDVFGGAEEWIDKVKEIWPKKPLSVAGAPKFRVYDIDFGWGRPSKVEVPSIRKMGAISVAESREDEGGVEIGVMLSKREMGLFRVHFFDGLEFPK